MAKIANEVPNFVKNQLLTADMLNGLVRFAEERTRQIKTDFIGSGVITGLEVSTSLEEGVPTITLSKGEGVTLLGKSIKVTTDEKFTKRIHLTGNERDSVLGLLGLQDLPNGFALSELTDDEPGFPFLTDANERENEIRDNDTEELLKNIFKEKILVLVLTEEEVEDGRPIFSLSEADAAKRERIRKILIDTSALTKLEPISLPRFGWKDGRMHLNRIDSFDVFHSFYQEQISNLAGLLSVRLLNMSEQLGQIFNSPEVNPFLDFQGAVDHKMNEAAFPDFQYLYDYLEDLTHAYNELCKLDIEFPKPTGGNCLVLGPLLEAERTVPSNLIEVELLYQRILAMGKVKEKQLAVFQSPFTKPNSQSAQAIRLVPGGSSLPIYFTDIKSVNSAEHSADKPNVSFYGVEGHIGLPLSDVVNTLAVKRQVLDLPFQVVAVQLDDVEKNGGSFFNRFLNWFTFSQRKNEKFHSHFPTFAKRYAGMQHGSGMPIGGTLVVVGTKGANLQKFSTFADTAFLPNEKYVVGDFFLPYQVEEEEVWEDFFFNETTQPFIQISKQHFTANDPNRYELNLFPSGGQLNDQIGITKENDRYFFTPILVSPEQWKQGLDGKKQMELRYQVDGKETILILTSE